MSFSQSPFLVFSVKMNGMRIGTELLYSCLIFIIFFLFPPIKLWAADIDGFPSYSWGGYLKNETAFRIREPVSFTKIRNILYLEGSADLSQDLKLYASGWTWYDAVYLFADYDTVNPPNDPNLPLAFVSQRAEEDERILVEYRELYLDWSIDNLDLRIGRQIIIWEQLLGFRILDEINPLNFREFILPDLIDFRIPLWTLKANYYTGSYQIEALWIPEITPHKPAPPGSEWELFQELPGQKEPPQTFRNSEAGFRIKRIFQGLDLAFSYFYTWDDFPTPFRKYTGFRFVTPPQKCIPTALQFDQPITDPDCGPVFQPQFKRMHIFGTAIMANLKSFILKGEASYIVGKYFGTRLADLDGDNLLDHDGALKRDHIRWGLEVDSSLFGYEYSLAISQWIIFDHKAVFFQDQYDTFISFFTRKTFISGALTGQVFFLYLINNEEILLKPKASYRLTDNIQLALGGDFFFGHEETLLPDLAAPANDRLFQFVGTFVNRDRIFFEIKYSF